MQLELDCGDDLEIIRILRDYTSHLQGRASPASAGTAGKIEAFFTSILRELETKKSGETVLLKLDTLEKKGG